MDISEFVRTIKTCILYPGAFNFILQKAEKTPTGVLLKAEQIHICYRKQWMTFHTHGMNKEQAFFIADRLD